MCCFIYIVNSAHGRCGKPTRLHSRLHKYNIAVQIARGKTNQSQRAYRTNNYRTTNRNDKELY